MVPGEPRFQDGPFVPVVTGAVVGDTVFFSAPVSDSLTTEGRHTMVVRATDGYNREGDASLSLTIDLTPPDPPVLDSFEGVWYSPSYRLTGTLPDESGALALVRVYRNNVFIDSMFTTPTEGLSIDVELVRGENIFTATFVDDANNESTASNAVTVRYDDASGLFLPAPFYPEDAFNVNLSSPGESVALYVYDLTGDLVVSLEDHSETQTYVLHWNGRNGNDETVKKGPLVVVVVVSMADGSRSTYRETFLFEPNPR